MKDFFSLYTAGLPTVMHVEVILLLLLGVVIGVMIGALPGLTTTMGVAIVTPLTYGMSMTAALALIMGVYCGGAYGGSITAIIAKIPGTPCAMMTALDGYPLGQSGSAGRAVGMATVSSCIGGIISVIILSICATPIASLALSFSAQEYFAVSVFGLCIIAYISNGSIIKGLISAVLGLLLATMGSDSITGSLRFTFNNYLLLDGFEQIPLLIGLFGLSEILKTVGQRRGRAEVIQNVGRALPTKADMKEAAPTILRGSVIGTIIGAIPAAGGTIASIMAYGVEKRVNKKGSNFGNGEICGVAAPESANNATTGGAMIPLLTLGVPGDAAGAILVAALLVHGYTPGPLMFTNHIDVVSSIYILMLLANIAFFFVGLGAAKVVGKIINVPAAYFTPVIMLLCCLGAYSIRCQMFDVLVLVGFGVLGFLFNRLKMPTAPLILGFILGNLVETGLRRGLLLASGNIVTFFTRPISTIFLSLGLLLLLAPQIAKLVRKAAGKVKKG